MKRAAATRRGWLATVGSIAAGALPVPGIAAESSAAVPGPSGASETSGASRWFTSSDGVRLHYLEAGAARRGAPTLVFVPGWTMPAWIWQAQIEHFAARHRVIAFDPRGQGRSAAAPSGYDYERRAADIAELLSAARAEDVVLIGWSLGVLESLQYMHDARSGPAAGPGPAPKVRALVLVDNSVGVGDPPPGNPTFFTRLRNKRRETMAAFVGGMFKRPPEARWVEALVDATLHMPLSASIDLLRQPRAREFWRGALYATQQPVLYAYTAKFAQQGDLVKQHRPSIETRLFTDAAHALFVDQAAAFNEMLEGFVARLPTSGQARESVPPK